MHTRFGISLLVSIVGASLLLGGPVAEATTLPSDARMVTQHVTIEQQQRLAGLNLPFIQNQGQLDKEVAYYARTFAGTAFVTRDGVLVLSLPGKLLAGSQGGMLPGPVERSAKRGPGWVLSERPVSQVKLTPQGNSVSPTHVSVFHGNNPKRWQKDLKTYATVSLGQPWPGIGYVIHAHGNTVERIFTVNPGAKANAIRMQIQGADELGLKNGALIAHTGNGPVTLSKPVAYQQINGSRKPVQVAYVLNHNRYGFRLGSYDHDHPVIIDPLIQATYLGGTGSDYAYALALGSSGQVYVAGGTGSSDFPNTSGGAQPIYNSPASDVFVAELNAGLSQIIQATYLGGAGSDYAYALAVAPSGAVYVAGMTISTAGFPGTSGGAQPNTGGASDAFVAVLNSSLTTISNATYLGGAGVDQANALAVGSGGQVYVAGDTSSSALPCTDATIGTPGVTCDSGTGNPPANNGAQVVYKGGRVDAFVAALNGDLTRIDQASYLGGTVMDYVYSLAMGSSGQVYVAGYTSSGDFPCTDTTIGTAGVTCDSGVGNPPAYNGAQRSSAGGGNAFVAEFNAGLTQIDQATYLGGATDDYAFALALGGGGQAYVAGYTDSSAFPCTDATVGMVGVTCDSGIGNPPSTNGAQPAYAGLNDAFVAELNGGLTQIVQATYLGGTGDDKVYALALGGSGQVYVAGQTSSGTGSYTNIPGTSGGMQPANAGVSDDAFIAQLSSGLTGIAQATYLGGSGVDEDVAKAMVVGGNGQLYVAGYTYSANFPGTSGGAQPVYAGPSSSSEGFVAVYNNLAAAPASSSSGGGGGAHHLWVLWALAVLALGGGLFRWRHRAG